MRIPRELLLIIALLVVVAVVSQQLAPKQETPAPDLASDSVAPTGARALYLWLESLGYRLERTEYRSFGPDEATSVLLILAPDTLPSKDDLAALRRWLEDGGTLVLAGDSPDTGTKLPFADLRPKGNTLSAFLDEFGLRLRPLGTTQSEATPGHPLLLRPVVGGVRVEATSYVTGTANLVSYLGEAERPIAASLAVGEGHLYVLASSYAFSNQGIGEADNAALLLNWLPAPGGSASVAFDEVHHGRMEARSLLYEAVRQPWGWATFYALGIIFLFLLLGGRHFGRPVPSVVDTRRVAAEYVVSLAGLLRRGGKGSWVARHYERTLRRQLVSTCGFDLALDTPAVVARVVEAGRVANGVEGRDAGRVLLELYDGANNGIGEGRLVRLAAETDKIIKACGGRRR